jgi:hypothetical protein
MRWRSGGVRISPATANQDGAGVGADTGVEKLSTSSGVMLSYS